MTKQDLQDFGRTVQLLTSRAAREVQGDARDAAHFEQRHSVHDASTLHRIAGSLHRIAERECNEDLTCPKCGGDGTAPTSDARGVCDSFHGGTCPKCKGEGTTTGPRSARLRAQAEAIAAAYGLRCYWQTDPRGCPLYLIAPEIVPSAAELAKKDVSHACSPKAAEYLRTADAWIDSNYTRGHAVVWMGR